MCVCDWLPSTYTYTLGFKSRSGGSLRKSDARWGSDTSSRTEDIYTETGADTLLGLSECRWKCKTVVSRTLRIPLRENFAEGSQAVAAPRPSELKTATRHRSGSDIYLPTKQKLEKLNRFS
ncbi:hypothetical protein EVAR_33336_1 [Eumeta japonica]|uniref:Uncharacterized protein n=1 Tax=Eumeta variegata TaxID=151549 RepID=A0A4C1YIT7_EUMVA|nr:hypothetical protein EVAR_33336_1 [Eumeta japonica]